MFLLLPLFPKMTTFSKYRSICDGLFSSDGKNYWSNSKPREIRYGNNIGSSAWSCLTNQRQVPPQQISHEPIYPLTNDSIHLIMACKGPCLLNSYACWTIQPGKLSSVQPFAHHLGPILFNTNLISWPNFAPHAISHPDHSTVPSIKMLILLFCRNF